MINKRIALYLPSLSGGGAERVMVDIANGIAARGFHVDLVVAKAYGPYLRAVSPLVRLVDLNAGRVSKSLWPLVRYLQRECPVAMLAAMNYSNVIAILARILARTGTRLIVSERTHIGVESSRAVGFIPQFVYTLVKQLYSKADLVTAVSQGAATSLECFARLPEKSVRVLYNPFDLDRIQALACEPVPHPWLVPGSPPVVIAIGRFASEKNFEGLIRAFAASRHRHQARLLILGDGKLRSELESTAANCGLSECDLQMPGYASNPYAYLSRSALFVLSSSWEGLPGVLIEAMACGVPVISTDCPSGPREILEDGYWGRLISVDDELALAEAIDQVLATPRSTLPDVRRRARDFEQDKAIDAYLEAFGLPPRPEGLVSR